MRSVVPRAVWRSLMRYSCWISSGFASAQAVFGVFDDETAARAALAALRPSYRQCYLCRPTHGGPRVTVRRPMFEKNS